MKMSSVKVHSRLCLVVLLCVQVSLQQDSDDDLCSTPRNDIGTCVLIRNCPYLYNTLNDKTNIKAVQYVQRSTCGFEGRLPKVCCPVDKVNRVGFIQRKPDDDALAFRNFPSSRRQECGIPAFNGTKKVVGGFPAVKGQWPWMAAIGYKPRGMRRSPANTIWGCGGVLITTRYVLSAAHCVVKETTGEVEPYLVLLGNLNVDEPGVGQKIEIEKSISHEQYTTSTKLNDAALFRLKREAILNDDVRLICLPYESNMLKDMFNKKSPFVAGWGTTETGPSSPNLLYTQLETVDTETCNDIYKSFAGAVINDNVICAGQLRGGNDTCQGDSGGPLMFPVKQNIDSNPPRTIFQYHTIGIVSYGYGCGLPGYVGVYARVTKYLQWIHDNIS